MEKRKIFSNMTDKERIKLVAFCHGFRQYEYQHSVSRAEKVKVAAQEIGRETIGFLLPEIFVTLTCVSGSTIKRKAPLWNVAPLYTIDREISLIFTVSKGLVLRIVKQSTFLF